MKISKTMLLITLTNFIILFLIILRMPSEIPIHVNYLMEIDNFGSKWVVLLFGILPVLLSFILYFYISKMNVNLLKSKKAEKIFLPFLIIFLIILTWLPVLLALNYDITKSTTTSIPIDLITTFPIGIFILIFSNFMSLIKYNPKYTRAFIGIRTPWTMKSETVWRKTHKLGGYLGVISGFIICLSSIISFVSKERIISIIGLFIGIFIFAVIPTIYSYIIYKKES